MIFVMNDLKKLKKEMDEMNKKIENVYKITYKVHKDDEIHSAVLQGRDNTDAELNLMESVENLFEIIKVEKIC